jgi:enediyne biosynthesis protein E4
VARGLGAAVSSQRSAVSCVWLTVCAVLWAGTRLTAADRPVGGPGGEYPSGRVVYTEVSREAGILFEHVNGATGRCYAPEVNTSGLAAFDYDGDGWCDLYVVNGAPLPGYDATGEPPTNRLYRNLGDGTFRDVTKEAGVGDTGYGMGCAAADYDGDGHQDLYVSNFGPNVLYRNRGDGTFADVTEASGTGDPGWGGGCAFADFDLDGDLDLYVANYLDYAVQEQPEGLLPYVSGRLQSDDLGGMALYAAPLSYPGASNRLYRNDGGKRFTDVAASAGVAHARGRDMGVTFLDYDDDGDPDLFVANDQEGNALFRNDGPWPGGTFTDMGLLSGVAYDGDGNAQATMGVCAGDYNNDGRLDLATASFRDEPFALYRNDGGGLFTDESHTSGIASATRPELAWGVVFLDCDNDGLLDLFMAAGHVQDGIERVDPTTSSAQQNILLRNAGNGRFEEISDESGPGLLLKRQSRGAVSLDFDNDGDLDLAVLNRYCRLPAGVPNGLDLLRNDGERLGNWLMVTLRGIENTHGVGARVSVWTAGRRKTREVVCGSGYQSQSDVRAHFGLGKAATVDSLVVRWPAGARQVWRGMQVNRIVTLVEGESAWR